MEVIHIGSMSNRKLLAKRFPIEVLHNSFMPDGKLLANSFPLM